MSTVVEDSNNTQLLKGIYDGNKKRAVPIMNYSPLRNSKTCSLAIITFVSLRPIALASFALAKFTPTQMPY